MNQYTLIWSPKAKEEYAALLSYIREWYGIEAALSFLEQTEKITENITIFPYSYPASGKVISLRKAVKLQNSLLFFIVFLIKK